MQQTAWFQVAGTIFRHELFVPRGCGADRGSGFRRRSL